MFTPLERPCTVKLPTSHIVLSTLFAALLVGGLAHGNLAADPSRGQMLWNKPGLSGVNRCSDCHGVTPSNNVSRIWNASGTRADQGAPFVIQRAIGTQRDMFEFSDLTDTDLADLAAYINAVRYGKAITPPTLSNEECLFNWAEVQLPTVFKAPSIQRGTVSTINYRLYSVDGTTNALGHNTVDASVWVLAPSIGFPNPMPLDSATSAGLFSASRAASCR